MARKVKCLHCGKQGDTDTFHKEVIKDKNRYFCNEFEYLSYIEDLESKLIIKKRRNDLINWIVETYYDYEPGMLFPTTLSKRLNPLFDFYPIEVIKESFDVNNEVLSWASKNKDFTNEFSKTCYIMKIVEGSINDCYNKYKYKIKSEEQENKNTVTFDDSVFEDLEINVVNKNSNDISSFLD